METEKQEIGRLAYRVEGDNWNAYWSRRLDSMEGALFLGSIRMSLATGNSERRAAFMELMNESFADEVEAVFGERPTFRTQPAPEHERAGRG